jgi:DNA sulfur modification protein DndC
MVDKDKSMAAMIKNNEDKQWMIPIAEFRDSCLPTTDDFKNRDFRRLDGRIDIFKRAGEPELIHGPYKQSYREHLLRELLRAQAQLREVAPQGMGSVSLISVEELAEIRRIWLEEKHEIEDSLPRIYEEAMGVPYPLEEPDERFTFSQQDLALLKEVCASTEDPDHIHYGMLREMLHIEQAYRGASRRVGIYDDLENALQRHAFLNREDALQYKIATKDEGWLVAEPEVSNDEEEEKVSNLGEPV